MRPPVDSSALSEEQDTASGVSASGAAETSYVSPALPSAEAHEKRNPSFGSGGVDIAPTLSGTSALAGQLCVCIGTVEQVARFARSMGFGLPAPLPNAGFVDPGHSVVPAGSPFDVSCVVGASTCTEPVSLATGSKGAATSGCEHLSMAALDVPSVCDIDHGSCSGTESSTVVASSLMETRPTEVVPPSGEQGKVVGMTNVSFQHHSSPIPQCCSGPPLDVVTRDIGCITSKPRRFSQAVQASPPTAEVGCDPRLTAMWPYCMCGSLLEWTASDVGCDPDDAGDSCDLPDCPEPCIPFGTPFLLCNNAKCDIGMTACGACFTRCFAEANS